MKQEIKHYFKKHWTLVLLHAVLVVFSLTLVFIFIQFTLLTRVQLNNFEDGFQGKAMFSISIDMQANTNTVIQRAEDGRVRWDENNVETISRFYDKLNQRSDIHFLSMNSQPVPIRGFEGGDRFDVHYGSEWMGNYEIGEHLYRDVKAIQMNQQAFEFFNLELANGQIFSWQDVDYSARSIPILLGHHYQDVYNIGDILVSEYPFENFKLEVYGFLSQGTQIFYSNQPNYFLDHYIVMPYPYSLQAYDPIDLRAKGFLSLDMINADIVVEDSDNALEFVLNVLSVVGESSGFNDYIIFGMSQFTTHFNRMIAILNYNAQLLQFILLFCIVIIAFISVHISKYLFRRRQKYYELFHISGLSYKSISKLILREILCTFSFVNILMLVTIYFVYIGLYPINVSDPLHLVFYLMFLALYATSEILVIIGIQIILIVLTHICLKSELRKLLS